MTRNAGALLVALALTACGGGTDTRTEGTGDGTGGTMIVVSTSEPGTLFPPRAISAQEQAVVASVFDRLAEIGPDLNTIGDSGFSKRLASDWSWAPDSLSIAFTINPTARWHDGAPVRAEDVRYSFHVYTAEAVGSSARSLLGNIDSVSVRDSLTAVVWFKRRTPQQFMDATYSMFILPSHLLASIPDSALVTSPFARTPVGTGRFRFSKWEKGSRLEIVADTTNARGRAKLDRVIWSYVPDFGAATVKLFAGEADLLERIRPEIVSQIATNPQLRLETNRPLQYGFVGFNVLARRDAIGAGARPHPVLGDTRVRRAFTMAVNRSRVVRAALDSMGLVNLAPAPRVLIPDTAALTPLPFDVAHARALLDSAGWVDSNGDGMRERDGKPLSVELLVPSVSPARVRLSVLLQAALKEIGADIKLNTLDPKALMPMLGSGDFDAWMGGWDANPGLQGLRQTWIGKGSSNYQHYVSAVFDAEVDSAFNAFTPAGRTAHFTKAFQQAIEDAPAIWLYEERLPVAIHARIRIAPFRADGWYVNLADWSIDPAQRIERDRKPAGEAR